MSETPAIYRSEYLAFNMLGALESDEPQNWTDDERLARVREFMAPRYSEGYVKGVHDTDAAKILAVLIELHTSLDLLRYPSAARALAFVFWQQFPDGEAKTLLSAKVRGFATMQRAFPSRRRHEDLVSELHERVVEFAKIGRAHV